MMTCSMKSCLSFYGLNMNETVLGSKSRGVCGFCPSFGSSQSRNSKSRALPVLSVDFMGKPLLFADQKQTGDWSPKSHSNFSVRVCEYFSLTVLYFCCILGTNAHYLISGTSIILCEPSSEMVGEDSKTQHGGDSFGARTCGFLDLCW